MRPRQIVLILFLVGYLTTAFAQRDTVFFQPALQIFLAKDQWKKRFQSSISGYYRVQLPYFSLKSNSEIILVPECSEGEQKYHEPQEFIRKYCFELSADTIPFEKDSAEGKVIIKHAAEEADGKKFYCQLFIYNQYFMGSIAVKGPSKLSDQIEKAFNDLKSNYRLLLPSEIDKMFGYPIAPAARDSMIKATIKESNRRIKEYFGINKLDSETESRIIEESKKDIDKKIKYQFTMQKFLDCEKRILAGALPIDEWFDSYFLRRDGENLAFYDAFDDRHHGETMDGMSLATSEYFSRQFVFDTTMTVDNIQAALPIVRTTDTIYWSSTVMYDQKTRSAFEKQMNDSVTKLVNQYMEKTGITDTFQATWEFFDVVKTNFFKKNLPTSDTLVIICFERRLNGTWKLSPAKFGVRAKSDDFYVWQDYWKERDTIQQYNTTGNLVIYANRAKNQIFVGNNKNPVTNFIPVKHDLDSLLEKYSIVYDHFNDAHYENYSPSYKSDLADSVEYTGFISKDIKSVLCYDSIIGNKNLLSFIDTSTVKKIKLISFPEGTVDEDKTKEANNEEVVKMFTANYLKSFPPEKRIYISDLFYTYDLNQDRKNEIFQVFCTNGNVFKIIIIQETPSGVIQIENNKDLENKILEFPVIKLMKRISQMQDNVLCKKSHRTTDPDD